MGKPHLTGYLPVRVVGGRRRVIDELPTNHPERLEITSNRPFIDQNPSRPKTPNFGRIACFCLGNGSRFFSIRFRPPCAPHWPVSIATRRGRPVSLTQPVFDENRRPRVRRTRYHSRQERKNWLRHCARAQGLHVDVIQTDVVTSAVEAPMELRVNVDEVAVNSKV
jgi:hypothetical protein